MFGRLFKRFARTAVSTTVAGVLVAYKDNPWMVAAVPLLSLVGKALREKDPEKWGWVPF